MESESEKAVLLDISGVLLNGDQVIPGAVEALALLEQKHIPYRLVTNTSRKTRDMMVDTLAKVGVHVDRRQIFTAPLAARTFARWKGLKTWCLVHPDLLPDLDNVPPEEADAVIVGDAASGFNYENLNQAFRLLLEGAALVAIGHNRYFKENGEFYLDAGPFINALEYSADRRAIVAGKPAAAFFESVASDLQMEPESCWMVGDDIFGDVQGAIDVGMQACLVQTGKYREGDESKLDAHYELESDVLAAVQRILEI